MFAASCIGVIGLVIILEFLRHLQRRYDRHIFARAQQSSIIESKAGNKRSSSEIHASNKDSANFDSPPNSAVPLLNEWRMGPSPGRPSFIPSVPQQVVRAAIYTLQFVVAYMIMLLAMYYNGYILVCIILGVFIGFFTFSWDTFGNTTQ